MRARTAGGRYRSPRRVAGRCTHVEEVAILSARTSGEALISDPSHQGDETARYRRCRRPSRGSQPQCPVCDSSGRLSSRAACTRNRVLSSSYPGRLVACTGTRSVRRSSRGLFRRHWRRPVVLLPKTHHELPRDQTPVKLADVEARTTATLDELGLTTLATSIDGLSPVGAVAILAETGDL